MLIPIFADDRQITDELLEVIMGEILVKNRDVRILSLNNNIIGDRGCKCIAASIPSLHNLRILYLSKTPLLYIDIENNQ